MIFAFKVRKLTRFTNPLLLIGVVLIVFRYQELHGNEESTTFTYLPVVLGPTPPDWLVYVNQYREMANLPSVVANSDWSYGNVLHGRYSVKNDVLIHDEDPNNPWFTPEGQAAARASNLSGSDYVNATFIYAVDSWMQAPFHAVGILDPALYQVGYGDYREEDGSGLRMGAGLDVIRGLTTIPDTTEFPIMWPANGTTVSLLLHWGEYPSPLTSCPGYNTPSGLPIILQIGAGDITPNVTSHSLSQNGQAIEHCVFDETNYVNPDGSLQNLGRGILNTRDAIVIIPRYPLTPGSTYDVVVSVNGNTYMWSFSVSNSASTSSSGLDYYSIVPTFDGD